MYIKTCSFWYNTNTYIIIVQKKLNICQQRKTKTQIKCTILVKIINKKENYLSDIETEFCIIYIYVCRICMRRLSLIQRPVNPLAVALCFRIHTYSASVNRNFEIFFSRSCEVQIFLKISTFQCVTRWGFSIIYTIQR